MSNILLLILYPLIIGETALTMAVISPQRTIIDTNGESTGQSESILQILLKSGCDLDSTTNDGFTLLMTAAKRGYLDQAIELIKAGANVNIKDRIGYSALNYAWVSFFYELLQ